MSNVTCFLHSKPVSATTDCVGILLKEPVKRIKANVFLRTILNLQYKYKTKAFRLILNRLLLLQRPNQKGTPIEAKHTSEGTKTVHSEQRKQGCSLYPRTGCAARMLIFSMTSFHRTTYTNTGTSAGNRMKRQTWSQRTYRYTQTHRRTHMRTQTKRDLQCESPSGQ